MNSRTVRIGHPIFHLLIVIFAETLNKDEKESICFYDFELDVWNDKKKIDRNGFKVRCEKVQWSNEVETSGCNDKCELSATKTCQSQFDGFCPTVRNCSENSVIFNCILTRPYYMDHITRSVYYIIIIIIPIIWTIKLYDII